MRRTALVTGAAGGLGALAARRLAAAAWDVVAVDVDEAGLAATALRSPNTHVRTCDATDPAALADVLAMAGPVHRVVHAAAATAPGPVLAQSPAEVERVLRTIVLGAVTVVQATLPGMLDRGAGELFLCPGGSGPPASAAAAAVAAYADALWAERGGQGVTLRCVHADGASHGLVLDAMDRSLARPAARIHVRARPTRRPPALIRAPR
ncbi:NADP-dependent 3-hydroxy acid dehydrogenase YdfG [Actinomadura madurae]|uniref:NADP-dependent 3-hydroxy acid dehydrogenase YdfG n=1 Tax=Actinomadura madurae TaxID=1993 RepID=A0A1I5C407_9ACTN|nr:SDR family NAD(P)-dependent oxidoreductase [Actinomadura madurae]SFN81564.1 NADP-dependent 3-hydroxy acid dehydrogenase YdfG [Actinomadura madurae]